MPEDHRNPQKNDTHPSELARRDFVSSLGSRGPCRYGRVGCGSPGRRRDRRRDQDSRRNLRRRVHSPEERLASGRADLARRIRLAALDARHRPSVIAAEGYSVLVPNPFYRVAKAPFSDASNFSFQNPADMAKLRPLMASVNAPGNPREGCGRLRRLPRRAERGEQGEEDRHAGLLHGRTAGGEDRRGAARSHWRGRVVPRRWPGDRQTR